MGERGVTLVELLVVILILGVTATIALPRALKTSPRQEVARAARQLARDLEQVRTQAVSTKRLARVKFEAAPRFYTAFLDVTPTRSGVIQEVEDEVRAARLVANGNRAGLPGVELPGNVEFGAGDAGAGPNGEAVSDAVALPDDKVEFNARGMVLPLGTRGVVYLVHKSDPSVVAAVEISGAGAFHVWHYRNSRWER